MFLPVGRLALPPSPQPRATRRPQLAILLLIGGAISAAVPPRAAADVPSAATGTRTGAGAGALGDSLIPATALDASAAGVPDTAAAGAAAIPFPRPFEVGETLRFSLQWGPIKAGTAVLAVEGIERVGAHECYRFASTARSLPFFSTFYKVEDRIESYADTRTMITRRTVKRLREGDYRLDQDIAWDHDHEVVRYADGATHDLVRGARDVLGAMYYVRALPLAVGDSIPIDTHDNKKSYPLLINVLREETIDTPVGRFHCWVVEPELQTSGLFRRSGSLTVWLTHDEHRMPVMMQSKIKVGAVSAILTAVERGAPASAMGAPASAMGAPAK